MLDTQMLIGAKFVAGTEAAEDRDQSQDRGDHRRRCPKRRLAQVDAAVDAAEKRSTPGRAPRHAERSALLLKLADRHRGEAEAFATLEALNCGKPMDRACCSDEIPAIVDCFRFFAGAVRCMHGAGGRRVSGRPHLA